MIERKQNMKFWQLLRSRKLWACAAAVGYGIATANPGAIVAAIAAYIIGTGVEDAGQAIARASQK